MAPPVVAEEIDEGTLEMGLPMNLASLVTLLKYLDLCPMIVSPLVKSSFPCVYPMNYYNEFRAYLLIYSVVKLVTVTTISLLEKCRINLCHRLRSPLR